MLGLRRRERKRKTVITGTLFDGETGETIKIEETDEIFFVGVKYSEMEMKIRVAHAGIEAKAEDSLEALGSAVVKILFECADGDKKIEGIYLVKFLEAVAKARLELFEKPTS